MWDSKRALDYTSKDFGGGLINAKEHEGTFEYRNVQYADYDCGYTSMHTGQNSTGL